MELKIKKCPYCKKQIREDAIICPECQGNIKAHKGVKKCKYCKTEIDGNAKVCPQCRKHQGSSALRIFLGVIIGIVGLIMIGSVLSKPDTKEEQNKYISLSEFNNIQNGMTYEQVKEIVGSEGTVISDTQIGDTHMIIYYWYGKDGISNANFNFQNNVLINKTQIGLQ